MYTVRERGSYGYHEGITGIFQGIRGVADSGKLSGGWGKRRWCGKRPGWATRGEDGQVGRVVGGPGGGGGRRKRPACMAGRVVAAWQVGKPFVAAWPVE